MKKPLPLCLDCRHRHTIGYRDCICEHPSAPKLALGFSVVDGPCYTGYYTGRAGFFGLTHDCYYMRKGGYILARLRGTCGREGRWFQPKEKD